MSARRVRTRTRLIELEREVAILQRLADSSQTDAGRLRRMTRRILAHRQHVGDSATLDTLSRIFAERS